MTWEEVLSYEADVKGIARKISSRTDPDLYEDAVHHAYIVMKEKIDLSRAEGPERDYVRGAIWNIVLKYFQSSSEGKWPHISIEQLEQGNFQIDSTRKVYWNRPRAGDFNAEEG